jgi:hypothetical protein
MCQAPIDIAEHSNQLAQAKQALKHKFRQLGRIDPVQKLLGLSNDIFGRQKADAPARGADYQPKVLEV